MTADNDTTGTGRVVRRGTYSAYAALAAAGCLWGTGFYFGKIDLEEMSVGHMLLYRFAFASLGLIPVAFRLRVRPRRNDVPLFLAAAALYVPLQFIVEFQGLARTTVSHASLMVGTLPLLLAAGAVVFTHERLDRFGWSMLIISTVGAVLIAFQAHSNGSATNGPTLYGDLLVLVSMLGGMGWVLMTQRVMHHGAGYPASVMTVYVLVTGSIMLAVWVIATEGLPPVAGISMHAWLALAAQGLLATTCSTLLWNWALQRVPAARAGIFINLEPVVGTMLGVTLLDESLGVAAVIGGLLIIGAAIAFTLRPAVEPAVS
jgi:drug/metabolite transporter (DMT)-like permease